MTTEVLADRAGRIIVEIYERAGSTVLGVFSRVSNVKCVEQVSGLGEFEFQVDSRHHEFDVVVVLETGREVKIIREGEGVIFRGIVQSRAHNYDDGAILTVRGKSLALELTWDNTHRGFEVLNRTMQQALDDILPATWTGTATGSYNNVTKRFDNMTHLAAIDELAKIGGAYWREDATARHIEIKDSFGDSAIRAWNIPVSGPTLQQNLDIAPITRMGQWHADSSELYNRIVPYGKTDGDVVFDLFDSNRSSPYTIQSKAIARPRIVSQIVVGESALGGSSFPTDGFTGIADAVMVEGTDRMILVLCSIESTSSVGMPVEYRANALATDEFLGGENQAQGRNNRVSRIFTPEIGPNKIECWYEVSGPPGDARHLIIALEHVDQHNPTSGVFSANGNSNAPSVTVTGADPLALIIDRLSHASATATPGSGQTELNNTSVNGFGNIFTGRSSIEPGESDGSTVMDWSLSAAVQWNIRALAINPARAYYIEDASSVATYGLRVQNLPMGSFKPLTPADRQAAANSMYDAAVDYLLDHKDPQYYVEGLEVAFMRRTGWFPGDFLWVHHAEELMTGNLNLTLVVTRREHSYDGDGARKWSFSLSTNKTFRRKLLEAMADIQRQLEALQQNQV